MEAVFLGIVTAFASNPTMLLLVLVLAGGGWLAKGLANKVLDGILTRVDKLDGRLQSIEQRLAEIVEIKGEVKRLDERVDRLEVNCDRRHTS